MAISIKGNAVENEKFKFRSPITRVGNAGGLEVGLGFPRHVTGVTVIILAVHRVFNIADKA